MLCHNILISSCLIDIDIVVLRTIYVSIHELMTCQTYSLLTHALSYGLLKS